MPAAPCPCERAVTIAVVFAAFAAANAHAAVFDVNTIVDGFDANPGDGACETAPGNAECTIRAALSECQVLVGPHTINVPAGTYPLASGDLDFHGAISMIGAGADLTVIDAQGASFVVRVHSDAPDATLQGLALVNGTRGLFNEGTASLHNVKIQGATDGGVFSPGTLALFDSLIDGNTSSGNGGGIYDFGGTPLALVRTTVSNNSVTGPSSLGGGIYVDGPLVLEDSDIVDNTSSNSGGGVVYSTSLQMRGGSISRNSATQAGGGVYASWPAVLRDCELSGNEAGTQGGALRITSTSVEIVGCTLLDNLAANGAGAYVSDLFAPSWVRLVETHLQGNIASASGGALLAENTSFGSQSVVTVERSTLYQNEADVGGGVYAGGGIVRISNSTLSTNDALSFGGGLFTTSNPQQVAVSYSTLVDNTAPSGAAIFNSGAPGPVELRASVLAGVPASNCGGNPPTSWGGNTDDGNSCALSDPNDLWNTAPLLGALGDNGGPTPTHLPGSPSPLVDALDGGCPNPIGASAIRDQRGYARPADGDNNSSFKCDIGAVELGATSLQATFEDDFEGGTTLAWSSQFP